MCSGSCETTSDGKFLGGTFLSEALLNETLTSLPLSRTLMKQKADCLGVNTQPCFANAATCVRQHNWDSPSTQWVLSSPQGLSCRWGGTWGKRFTISDALCGQGHPQCVTSHCEPSCKVLPHPEDFVGNFHRPGGSQQQSKSRNGRQHQNPWNPHFSLKQDFLCTKLLTLRLT